LDRDTSNERSEEPMNRIVHHIRSNAVAYVALFVALGGSSYAAVSLPANSVGTRQIKNHSVTPMKLDRSAIGGSVRYWARISENGKIIASQPKAQIVGWYTDPTGFYAGGIVRWRKPIAPGCFSLATAESVPRSISVSAETVAGNGKVAQVRLAPSAVVPVDVAVVCPAP
jgi:hypothetical protein